MPSLALTDVFLSNSVGCRHLPFQVSPRSLLGVRLVRHDSHTSNLSFPLTLSINKFAQAILAGNCMILKAPPTAPCLVVKIVELAQKVLPPGVLQVLNGGNDL